MRRQHALHHGPHALRQSHQSCSRQTGTISCCLQVHAALIVVLTRGGSTARLVAKYRPSIPVLTVAVPVLTTDALTWTCSGESPARQCLITRGLLPLLAEGSARATDSDTTDEILAVSPSRSLQGCLKWHGKGDFALWAGAVARLVRLQPALLA